MKLEDAQKTLTSLKHREYFYKEEADPLFLKYQREEIEKQVWLDKIAEIKERYPYPEGCTVEEAQKVIDEEIERSSIQDDIDHAAALEAAKKEAEEEAARQAEKAARLEAEQAELEPEETEPEETEPEQTDEG